MGSSAATYHFNRQDRRQDYQQITSRFGDPCDCLTAHMMLECSETLAGVKPANLVSLVNRVRPCGRNLYHIWQQHHHTLAGSLSMLRFKVLQTTERAMLLFCYNPELLEAHLAHPGIRTLLAKAGYDTAQSAGHLLDQLGGRLQGSDSFPHEIGLFIGYPAKDVAAFMGLVKLPFTCQGPWKIYGNPDKSLCLADTFRHSRHTMVTYLTGCSSPADCLKQSRADCKHFFGKPIDNSVHYQ